MNNTRILKNIFLIFLFGLSSNLAFASSCYEDRCVRHDLNVRINNNGSENCSLVKAWTAYPLTNKLVDSSIPTILASTSELYKFTITGDKIDYSISYQCGTYKKFTLHMRQYYKKKHWHSTSMMTMEDTVDVFETHEIGLAIRDHGTQYHNVAGTVAWHIAH